MHSEVRSPNNVQCTCQRHASKERGERAGEMKPLRLQVEISKISEDFKKFGASERRNLIRNLYLLRLECAVLAAKLIAIN